MSEYMSKDGSMMARIILVEDGTAYIERWNVGGVRRVRFSLPVSFLSSTACGWQPAPRDPGEDAKGGGT